MKIILFNREMNSWSIFLQGKYLKKEGKAFFFYHYDTVSGSYRKVVPTDKNLYFASEKDILLSKDIGEVVSVFEMDRNTVYEINAPESRLRVDKTIISIVENDANMESYATVKKIPFGADFIIKKNENGAELLSYV